MWQHLHQSANECPDLRSDWSVSNQESWTCAKTNLFVCFGKLGCLLFSSTLVLNLPLLVSPNFISSQPTTAAGLKQKCVFSAQTDFTRVRLAVPQLPKQPDRSLDKTKARLAFLQAESFQLCLLWAPDFHEPVDRLHLRKGFKHSCWWMFQSFCHQLFNDASLSVHTEPAPTFRNYWIVWFKLFCSSVWSGKVWKWITSPIEEGNLNMCHSCLSPDDSCRVVATEGSAWPRPRKQTRLCDVTECARARARECWYWSTTSQ